MLRNEELRLYLHAHPAWAEGTVSYNLSYNLEAPGRLNSLVALAYRAL